MATSRPHPEREPLLHPSGLSTSSSAFAAINASEPHLSSVGHFAFVSDQEIAKLSEGLVPQNTAKMTSWALKNFQDWMTNRNKRNPGDPVPSDLLECCDPVRHNDQLSKFVVETRKSTEEHYPPATLHQLLYGT